MFAKLIGVITCLVVTGACLLAVRQQRLQAVGAMTDDLERAGVLRAELWEARARIGRFAREAERAALAQSDRPMRPLPVEWSGARAERVFIVFHRFDPHPAGGLD